MCELIRFIEMNFLGSVGDLEAIVGSNHRVLFQNADVSINMGVLFNDPDIELYDIYWYLVRVNSEYETLNIAKRFDERSPEFYRILLRITLSSGIYLKAVLAEYMEKSLVRNEGLITVDQKLNTKSCYVELHRNSEFNNNDFILKISCMIM